VVFANKSYTGVFESSTGNSNPVSGLQYKCIPCPYNLANWSDAHSVDLYNKAIAASDATTQNALFKELNVYIIDQCDFIGIASPQQLGCYWPWVKNYSQEVEGGYQNYVPILRLMWLDSGVRKQLGY
jgi:ABC-type transport system substrate-binding protein